MRKGTKPDGWILVPRTRTVERLDSTNSALHVHMQTDRQTDVLKEYGEGDTQNRE